MGRPEQNVSVMRDGETRAHGEVKRNAHRSANSGGQESENG